MKSRSLVFLFVLFSFLAEGQQYLYVKKKGELPAERLTLHDNVKIKVSDTTSWVKGPLEMINTESIKVKGQVFRLKEVKAIRVNNGLMRLGGTAMWAGGILFTSVALINGIINDDNPVIYPGQIAFGSGLVAGGVLVSWLSRKTYSREKGYFYEVIDLNKDFQVK